MSVNLIPNEELVRRAVSNARCKRCPLKFKHYRWVAVMEIFALGSTYAKELCVRSGLDPDEVVQRLK